MQKSFDRHLLPVRLRPEPDELFSSWLNRLAMAHFSKLHTFSSIVFSKPAIWNRDIDKSVEDFHIAEIAARTGIEKSLISATTLRAYEGKIYESHNPKGNSTWLMPIGVYRLTRNRFGLQMCPHCLREDANSPYFRRLWRVSWSTVCLKHKSLLLDRCPDCQSPIMFHRGDMGWRAQTVSMSLARCSVCGSYWNSSKIAGLLKTVSDSEVILQQKLENTLADGWTEIKESGAVHSLIFFNGLKHLLRLLSVSCRSRRFREAVSLQCGIEATTDTENYHHFDHLPVALRHSTLQMANWLLDGWQTRFIEAAEAGRIYSSILLSPKEDIPFWYWSPVHDCLTKKTYQITDAEIFSALGWLEKKKKLILPSDLENLMGRISFEHKSERFVITVYERMAKHNQSCEQERFTDIRCQARDIATNLNGYSKTKARTLSQKFLRQHKTKPKGFLKTQRMYANLVDRYKRKERLRMVRRMEREQNAAAVAAEFQVSPAVVTKWYRRYKKNGVDGLSDLSRIPHVFRHQKVFEEEENWIRGLHAENLDLSGIQKELMNRYDFKISEGGLHTVLRRLNLVLPCSKKNRFVKSNRRHYLSRRCLPHKKIFAKQEKWILDMHEEGLNNSRIRGELIRQYNFSVGLNAVRETLLKHGKRSPRSRNKR